MRIRLALLIAIQLAGCSTDHHRDGGAPASFTQPLRSSPTMEDLRRGWYAGIYEEPVQLEHGRYEGEPFLPGASSRPTLTLLPEPSLYTDLDGDGIEEAIVALVESSGGSGSFVYLSAMTTKAGRTQSLATTLVGDRVQLSGLGFENGRIVASFRERNPVGGAGRESRRDWTLEGARFVEQKIAFDLEGLDSEGLYGLPDGKRAISYEFCVPRRPDLLAAVAEIDPTARPAASPGRIGCSPDEVLHHGTTHQPRHREVLEELAALPWIARIEEAFFE